MQHVDVTDVPGMLRLVLFNGIVPERFEGDDAYIIPSAFVPYPNEEAAGFSNWLCRFIWGDTVPALTDCLQSLCDKMNDMPTSKAVILRMLFLDDNMMSIAHKVRLSSKKAPFTIRDENNVANGYRAFGQYSYVPCFTADEDIFTDTRGKRCYPYFDVDTDWHARTDFSYDHLWEFALRYYVRRALLYQAAMFGMIPYISFDIWNDIQLPDTWEFSDPNQYKKLETILRPYIGKRQKPISGTRDIGIGGYDVRAVGIDDNKQMLWFDPTDSTYYGNISAPCMPRQDYIESVSGRVITMNASLGHKKVSLITAPVIQIPKPFWE